MTEKSAAPRNCGVWVDADACPIVIKEILIRAAKRTRVVTTFVANQYIQVPSSPFLASIQVPSGFDVADDYIVQQVIPGDLVITGDIPLAAEVIEAGGLVINSRGEELTTDNVRQRLNVRDFMDTMRSSGVRTGGPPPLDQRDKQAFANALDRFLARLRSD